MQHYFLFALNLLYLCKSNITYEKTIPDMRGHDWLRIYCRSAR